MSDFDRLAQHLGERVDLLLETVFGRLRGSLAGWMVENVFLWEEIREFARASLMTQLTGFRLEELPEICPEVDAAGAAAAARVGELKGLLNGYRVGQMVLWEAWLDLVEGEVDDPPGRRRLLKRGSDYFFRYANLVTDYVAEIYQRELELSLRSGEQRRFDAIRTLLEGHPLHDSQLDFDLEQHHLGFVSWGKDSEACSRALGHAVGRPVLLIPVLNRGWWGWLSGARPLSLGEERELRHFGPPAGTGVAIGLEAFGQVGFSATNRQALRARWVARKTHRAVVFYADVAVEALASDNQSDARAFVAHELRGIEDDSATSQRIRETLAAYFAAEQNAASAAAALGVHQQTVANRLRSAEERIGQPVGARRVELEVALRLRAALTPEE